jgi:hypothetical protein
MHSFSTPLSVDSTNGQWIAIGTAAATILYVAIIRPMLKKRDPMTKAPASSSLAQQRSVEREMSNLLVELSEMTRQLSAQLDTRSAKLEELMRQADQKIAELRALGILPANPDALPAPPIGSPEALAAGASSSPAEHPLAGLGLIPADAAGVPARAIAAPATFADRSQVDPRHAQIYAFIDQGLSPQEIAQRLGQLTGEVELILKLRSHTKT